MLLVAFGIKAAVFPLSFWLPDSYPTAPAPVTAVFAGLLTKVGVYAMVRTETLLFPGDTPEHAADGRGAADHGGGDPGCPGAERHQTSAVLHPGQPHRLHGVRAGHVLRGRPGAAVFYVAHHITIQTSLFLVTGLIERRGGSSSVDRLGGLAKLSPAAGDPVLHSRP